MSGGITRLVVCMLLMSCLGVASRWSLERLSQSVAGLQGSLKPALLKLVRQVETGATVIVYATFQAQADEFAGYLAANGVPSCSYHAGKADQVLRRPLPIVVSWQAELASSAETMSMVRRREVEGIESESILCTQERERLQQEFCAGGFKAVVATLAFGMGLDAPHVRAVIHLSLPRSIEEYVQQVRRHRRRRNTATPILGMHSVRSWSIFIACTQLLLQKNMDYIWYLTGER